ncbi:3-oxoacyl-[acyl-carrier-protein] synthase III C-terminal domain-containing protein, partial [Blastococcus sp. CCUG 61487]|uniref:3-oxoacyl-[acyl-carrier-protein] synthase III C-terminal domain-containing protein n=1 Tax=Blastococcus sp. CCUG 61487 TaxID=1840703 RepID=UPI0010C08D34
MPEPVFVRGIASVVGEATPIDSIGVLSERPESLAGLKAKGLSHYAHSHRSPAELALDACRQTMAWASVAPAEVDAVIYASMSFWDKRLYTETDIGWLMDSAGLTNAFPVGVFLPGCANLISSLRMAANLVRAEGLRNVLVVTTDQASPHDENLRVMWPDVSVLSDAAASCLVSFSSGVSDGGIGAFEVCTLLQHSAPAMWDLSADSNLAAFLMGTVKGARHTAATALERAQVPVSDVRKLLTSTYNRAVNEMMARQCGFSPDQLWLDNIPRLGHAFSADTLINLFDSASSDDPAEGEQFLLLATGHKNWGAAVLRKGLFAVPG